MIVDRIDNVERYRGLHPALVEALEYLNGRDFSEVEPGKYDFGKFGSRAGVSVYETRSPRQALPEAHRKFVDVQYIVSGVEWIGYAPLAAQDEAKPYDEERDIIFYRAETSLVAMDAGMFAIFYPEDLHMPGIDRDNPGGGLPSVEIKKVVVKVPLAVLST